MTNIDGVVRMLKKEQDRLAKDLRGIGAVLAAFGTAFRTTDKNSENVSGWTGKNRGRSKSTMGEGESKAR